MLLRCTFFIGLMLLFHVSFSQFSISTDGSVLRNWNRNQKFFAFGQSVQTNFFISKTESIYAGVYYYSNGNFKNTLTAIARDSANPAITTYSVNSTIRYRQLSLGWKHYFKGAYDAEDWNLYGFAGFGLLMGRASNRFSKIMDTALYKMVYPVEGVGNFKRLTFDMALGAEAPMGTNVYLYTELRSWIAASHYPSPYLHQNSGRLPTALSLNMGLRVLIE